jgi:uncharacterized protein (UPF0218 family)
VNTGKTKKIQVRDKQRRRRTKQKQGGNREASRLQRRNNANTIQDNTIQIQRRDKHKEKQSSRQVMGCIIRPHNQLVERYCQLQAHHAVGPPPE